MRKLIKISLAASLPVLFAAGCSDFLKGGQLNNSPNSPVVGSATNNNLFMAIQMNLWYQQESEVPWSVAQWMQELHGVARQQVGIYQYTSINNGTFDGDFQAPYDGGGLVDLHQLETQALAGGDTIYVGVAQVVEAWMIGSAADMWGAIPYSQADSGTLYPTPVLDPQQTVYTEVQNLLSTAIVNLGKTGGSNSGPTTSDLVYGGNAAKWIALAHTLKARFFLHGVLAGWNTWTDVLNEATLGIGSNSGDYAANHTSSAQFSFNMWYQFMSVNGGTGRAGDLIADPGVKLWSMLTGAADPRAAEYFDAANAANGYMSAYRLSAAYKQPFVTYDENQLILAEANLQLGNNGPALTNLQNEQNEWHSANKWHQAVAVAVNGGPATMNAIMTEKYFMMFQNIEWWNDWKRECIPTLTPVTVLPLFGNTVPSRLLYGATEEQTNPNVPAIGTGTNGAFNANDVNQGCTS